MAILGFSGSVRPCTQKRPVTFGSIPVPEMSLPARSTMRTSISSNGNGGTRVRASSANSVSSGPPTSVAVRPAMRTTSPEADSTDATPPNNRPVARNAVIPA